MFVVIVIAAVIVVVTVPLSVRANRRRAAITSASLSWDHCQRRRAKPTVAYTTRMPRSTRRPRSRSSSSGSGREHRRHRVDALFEAALREIAGVFGGVARLDDDHLVKAVAKVAEGHRVLTMGIPASIPRSAGIASTANFRPMAGFEASTPVPAVEKPPLVGNLTNTRVTRVGCSPHRRSGTA